MDKKSQDNIQSLQSISFEFLIPFCYNLRNILPKLQRALLVNTAPASVGALHFSCSLCLCSCSILPNTLSPFTWPKSISSTTNQSLFWGCQLSSKLWQIFPLDRSGEESQFRQLGYSLVPRHLAPCQLQESSIG